MKKLKNKTVYEYTIRVKTDREYFKVKKGEYKWGKTLWLCNIDNSYSRTMFSADTEKEMFDKILKEKYLHTLSFKEIVLRKLMKWLIR